MANTALKPKVLPYLFENLVEKYQDTHLAQCETKEKQKWRFASGEKSTEKIKLLAKYFPELLLLLNSLDKYSLCEKHYNQCVANDYFIEDLKKTDSSSGSSSLSSVQENERKRLKLIVDDDNATQDNTQVQDYATLMLELIDTKKQLMESKKQLMEYEEQQTHYFNLIKELESQNTKLLSENQELKEKLNSRFNDQQTRVG